MYKLKTIELVGFRGQSTLIKLHLNDDANFLIGRNGTGKTTLINLIHAALSADAQALKEARFDSMEFRFKRAGSRQAPRVSIKKAIQEDGIERITYSLRESSNSDPDEYVVSPIRRKIVTGADGVRRIAVGGGSPARKPLRLRLKEIYKTTWLSLQRGADVFDDDDHDFDNEEKRTDVDRKLEQVLNELVKYFSRLDRLVADKTQQFQKEWFLSFLANEKTTQGALKKIDVDEERAALTAIFEKFNMAPESYESQLDKHLRLAERASETLKSSGSIPFRDYLIFFDVMRLHSLVVQWQELQLNQKQIYSPKTEFENIASEMLFRKNISVNRSNQVIINSDEENVIQPRNYLPEKSSFSYFCLKLYYRSRLLIYFSQMNQSFLFMWNGRRSWFLTFLELIPMLKYCLRLILLTSLINTRRICLRWKN